MTINTPTNHVNDYTLGRGALYFARDDDDGYRFLGNVPAFNVNVQTQKLEHYSSVSGVGQKDLDIPTQINRSSTITLEDISHDNLALYFLGDNVTLSQTSLSAQTYSLIAKGGRMYQIGETDNNPTGYRKITLTSLKKDTTALVLNTDYSVDLERGIVTLADTSSVFTDGDTLVATFDVAASSREQTVSGQKTIRGKVKFLSSNPQGSDKDYYMPSVIISPNGDFALIAENSVLSTPLTVDIQIKPPLAAVYVDGAVLDS